MTQPLFFFVLLSSFTFLSVSSERKEPKNATRNGKGLNLRSRIDSTHPSPSLTSPIRKVKPSCETISCYIMGKLLKTKRSQRTKHVRANSPAEGARTNRTVIKNTHQPKEPMFLWRSAYKAKKPRRTLKSVEITGGRGTPLLCFLAKRSLSNDKECESRQQRYFFYTYCKTQKTML